MDEFTDFQSPPEKLTDTKDWQNLANHFNEIKHLHLRELFAGESLRAEIHSRQIDNLYFDFSKNRITQTTIDLLLRLAESRHLMEEVENMFTGRKINKTEDRAVLHTALRNQNSGVISVDGEDIIPQVREVLGKMKKITGDIRMGTWRGAGGRRIKNIVNLGIGGSDLGPRMATNALRFYSDRRLRVRYVSNVDGTDISETLRELLPEETLFIIASKTFTTLETLTNANTARNWILDYFKSTDAIRQHFFALTSNKEAAQAFGIDENNILGFWDWVGGRFSLCSAIGLPLMIAIGHENFMELLKGCHWMDNHFRNASLANNIPVLMALIGIWYNNFFKTTCHVVLPYDYYLRLFPSFLQQMAMESNGKSMDRQGNQVDYQTAPVIWGDIGTNGQHAFFQLLHQGTGFMACDFIGFVKSLNPQGDHHRKLMANLFAQSEALAFGKTREELVEEGVAKQLIPFKSFAGNRPSNTLLFDKLTPFSLGQLIALYEHKTFVEGVIWNIYSFDQWGVELGKQIAGKILAELSTEGPPSPDHDSSTLNLIRRYKKLSSSPKSEL